MNQSILFSDEQQFDESRQCVIFPAQQCGALLSCVVSVGYLAQLSGDTIHNKTQALSIFEQYRFDLEERAEELIEDEIVDVHGEVLLG